MEGLIINHQIEVHLPVEIPHQIYEQAGLLFSNHLKKYCEEQLRLGGDYLKSSSLQQGFYKDGLTQVCHLSNYEKKGRQVHRKK